MIATTTRRGGRIRPPRRAKLDQLSVMIYIANKTPAELRSAPGRMRPGLRGSWLRAKSTIDLRGSGRFVWVWEGAMPSPAILLPAAYESTSNRILEDV